MKFSLLIGTTNLVKLEGLKDKASGGGYENSATVQVTLYSEKEMSTEVAGQSWPASLAYIVASDGDYEGYLEDDLAVVEGQDYWAKLVADAGVNKMRTWRLMCRAEYGDM